ncbi:hypothetical protein ACSTIO_23560, partial [Vibrio parahaemolyticus]
AGPRSLELACARHTPLDRPAKTADWAAPEKRQIVSRHAIRAASPAAEPGDRSIACGANRGTIATAFDSGER